MCVCVCGHDFWLVDCEKQLHLSTLLIEEHSFRLRLKVLTWMYMYIMNVESKINRWLQMFD